MTTTSPEAAVVEALAAYLRTGLQAVSGLADSDTVAEWPEPTADLALSPSRVLVAVLRAGPAEADSRIGGPLPSRVTTAPWPPTGTARYDFGQMDVPVTLGLWAESRGLRDDADEVLSWLLNQPYWTTVPPIASTVTTAPIAKGRQTVTPASMAGISPGTHLQVGGGETVRVESTTPTSFVATFAAAHAAGVGLAEVAGRRRYAETGLSLRVPMHYDVVARYDFDPPRPLDDAEGGRGSQRQEWRSIRQGTASLRRIREVVVPLQSTIAVRRVPY